MAGQHTLAETERQVSLRLSHMNLDFDSMAVTANLFRAANSVRNHLERTVLAQHELSWTAFLVLWVCWIWEPIETRDIAVEGGISKATLTGVLSTLESRKLLVREKSKTDGRLVLVTLTEKGRELMDQLFPEFNSQETEVASPLNSKQKKDVAEALRVLAKHAAK